jgi:hypothetical protein
MTIYTETKNWGAVSLVSLTSQLTFGFRGTIYEFRNMDTGERFDFLLATLGAGLGLGIRVNQIIRNAYKAATKTKDLSDPSLYTIIPCNKAFSADDLDWSPGAEATAGVTFIAVGYTLTTISAWPFFNGPPKPGEVVNNDYFSGAEIKSKFDLGLSGQAAFQFMGRWIKVS